MTDPTPRHPTKRHALDLLRRLDVPVGTVIDVGLLSDTAELRQGFADRKQLLIEPIVEWNDTIRGHYDRSGVDYELINVAAADRDGEMAMELSTVIPGMAISHARLTDDTAGPNRRIVPVRKLDTLIAERPGLARPFLLKLDVDGAKLAILEGARGILPDVSVVVIEANVRNFVDRSLWLTTAGFTLFDIMDICYYDGRLRQVDLVFLNTALMQARGLDMYAQAFDMGKWVNFA